MVCIKGYPCPLVSTGLGQWQLRPGNQEQEESGDRKLGEGEARGGYEIKGKGTNSERLKKTEKGRRHRVRKRNLKCC